MASAAAAAGATRDDDDDNNEEEDDPLLQGSTLESVLGHIDQILQFMNKATGVEHYSLRHDEDAMGRGDRRRLHLIRLHRREPAR